MITQRKPTLPIKLQPSNLRPIVFRTLTKKHGLNINSEALAVLTDIIGQKFGFAWKSTQSQQFLEEIAKYWKLEDRGIFIDSNGLKHVIKDIYRKEDAINMQKATRSDTIVDDDDNNSNSIEDEVEIQWEDYFKFISPNEQPPSRFDKTRKQFIVSIRKEKLPILASLSLNARACVESKNNQYHLIMDRLSRNENFQKSSMTSISNLSALAKDGVILHNEITLIKNMLGRDGQKFLLFGLLSKNSSGEFILEDSTDHIELNLSQALKNQSSFYCAGMFILVEGIYSASGGKSNQNQDYMGGCFYVSNIANPPAERRDKSLEAYGLVDFLGVHRHVVPFNGDKTVKIPKQYKKKLVQIEKSLSNHKLIFLGSDLHFDSPRVIEGLRKFLHKLENSIIEDEGGSESMTPLALVLSGPFSSKPLASSNTSVTGVTNSEMFKSNFDQFTNLLGTFPNVVHTCKIVLVPGENDPWQSTHSLGSFRFNALPQASIPRVFVNRLEKLLPRGNLILAWNPTRINYLSQEIVIFKDNLMNRFKRNDLLLPHDLEMEKDPIEEMGDKERIDQLIQRKDEHISNKIKQARKLVKALLDQGTLQPFENSLRSINLQYDYSLRIEPSPNVIILNDASFDNFEVTYQGCKVVNLTKAVAEGARKFNYLEYYPSFKKFEFKNLYF
ncbi:DPB2 [Candida oxycetoniae]|uniref:DNA polymerase epsilon subunit B n=1 Tax=Candida oxycetoniae TaxID=497107 RepID=A0AAI9T2F0_9ASCO|nr:DPB2 [Candida oxycetoniae]KAI3406930.1 DPB2 [Candida oxycetoniae]